MLHVIDLVRILDIWITFIELGNFVRFAVRFSCVRKSVIVRPKSQQDALHMPHKLQAWSIEIEGHFTSQIAPTLKIYELILSAEMFWRLEEQMCLSIIR